MSSYQKGKLFFLLFSAFSLLCNYGASACDHFDEELTFIASRKQGLTSCIIEVNFQFLECLPSVVKDEELLESLAILRCWTLRANDMQPYMSLIESRCEELVFTGAHMVQGEFLKL